MIVGCEHPAAQIEMDGVRYKHPITGQQDLRIYLLCRVCGCSCDFRAANALSQYQEHVREHGGM